MRSSVTAQTQEQSTPTSTESPTLRSTQNHSTSLSTAIEVGIGVPLGLAVIGLFGFLFWRETMRQRKFEPRIRSQRPVPEEKDRSTTMFMDGRLPKLPNAQLPREMDGPGRFELSNI